MKAAKPVSERTFSVITVKMNYLVAKQFVSFGYGKINPSIMLVNKEIAFIQFKFY